MHTFIGRLTSILLVLLAGRHTLDLMKAFGALELQWGVDGGSPWTGSKEGDFASLVLIELKVI